MFEQDIKPYLSKLTPEIIYSRTVKIGGMGESYVADAIKDILASRRIRPLRLMQKPVKSICA